MSLFHHSIRWVLAAACLAAMLGNAAAGAFTRGCAARDLQLLKLIEDRENKNAIAPQTLSEALLTMLHARMVCYEGRVVDALALYDSVSQSILPSVMSERLD